MRRFLRLVLAFVCLVATALLPGSTTRPSPEPPSPPSELPGEAAALEAVAQRQGKDLNPVVNKGGKEIIVRAEVSVPGQKPVNMDFTTYQSGNKYRAYNVAIEGASLVTVYRNQFGETIKAKGIDGLIAELKAKNGSK